MTPTLDNDHHQILAHLALFPSRSWQIQPKEDTLRVAVTDYRYTSGRIFLVHSKDQLLIMRDRVNPPLMLHS